MTRTLLFSRSDVERLLTPAACIAALEDACRELAHGRVPPPAILGVHGDVGSFHVKAGLLAQFFAAKVNANFPNNGTLPTVQGAVILFDARNGVPLAIMDSIAVTALRTAAASAVAAKHLALPECDTMLIVGCGGQARSQLRALLEVRPPRRVLAYDQDGRRAAAFAAAEGVTAVSDLAAAVGASRIIVTCTTARRYFITREMVQPGTFIAAVGADSEHKQEIDPQLLGVSKVVTDLTEQAATIGDLHHAIAGGTMTRASVHAELAEVVAGRKSGRSSEEEIIVFDSTGTGLQDVAAAIAVYGRAIDRQEGNEFNIGS